MPEVALSGGSRLDVEVHGAGPVVLLPVDPSAAAGEKAEVMRQWGADPELGRSLIRGLSGFRVVAFDYEGHVLAHPRPDTLTPATIAADFLAVADAVGAPRFAYYGYSWLALSGLQLALRTDRLDALVMGGFPPLSGPYEPMLAVTHATHELSTVEPTNAEATPGDWDSVEVTLSPGQTKQFVTLYEALRDFDDEAAQPSCARLCFAGSADRIEYGERWGGVTVDIAGPLDHRLTDLVARGWDVEVLDGLDHMQAMQAGAVLPVVRPWLEKTLG
ncbi:alpha/beta fold hydrolase [Amycolatopsis jiangsuensis]|uniref:Pimeloyl-ACP methyl ester carboxylesterase n=1 Tax=Amycolatopsis jiangsuensis TaxID=1181879 RepID=A0A840IVK4_9PSEU|nr:alpha/beta hydrolase [Amycolatopsis jiangsuensis]MBB4685367.1 pimeloyl-ACP methyl ester carboxylesterase [Amycolatopsis jiangsuensis]